MPELPEVETIRRGLAAAVAPGTLVELVHVARRDLRAPVPPSLARRLAGRRLQGFRRWGKYLLWDLDDAVLLCHLGMSGTWRFVAPGEERRHDHVTLTLAGGRRLVFHDPRRFGLIDLVKPGAEATHAALRDLGPDPLTPPGLGAERLHEAFAGRTAPVKNLLMDQRLIAGIGNIYAAEALFRSGIRPEAPAGRLSLSRLGRLAGAVREVLEEAIAAGGSTLRDFRQADGELGYFQDRFQVYGREGSPCVRCGRPVRDLRLAGRATAWCAGCQR